MTSIKQTILKIPGVKQTTRKVLSIRFTNSPDYWEKRYQKGGNSGAGSYGKNAAFKSQFLNEFVKKNKVKSVIEFGCGDGNQTQGFKFPQYTGLDITQNSIALCTKKFAKDKTKNFFLYNSLYFTDKTGVFKADLTMSLDVIYHLIEDQIFEKYMHDLFNASSKYVIIYSTDIEKINPAPHVKNRIFSPYVKKNFPRWKLTETVKNFDATSNVHFFIYEKR